MTGYMIINDLHLSDRPPSTCTDSYLDDLFDLLDQTVDIAADRDLDAVVFAGDLFHHKVPIRTSHGVVMRLMDTAGRYPCPVLAVPGNHDLSHDRLASLDETQPLGVVFAAGAMTCLDGWANGLPLYGVPWLGDWTDPHIVDNHLAAYSALADPEHPSLVVAHAPLYPPGLELPYEHTPAAGWADAMDNHGAVAYGHVHEPHGIYTVGGVTFCNPGALSRGSLHEHNLTRAVCVAIWEPTTGFEIVALNAKPAEQILRIPQAVASLATANLDAFLTSIGQARLDVTSLEAVREHVRTLGLDVALTTLIDDLLDTASAR